jgi:hypothetical protein
MARAFDHALGISNFPGRDRTIVRIRALATDTGRMRIRPTHRVGKGWPPLPHGSQVYAGLVGSQPIGGGGQAPGRGHQKQCESEHRR